MNEKIVGGFTNEDLYPDNREETLEKELKQIKPDPKLKDIVTKPKEKKDTDETKKHIDELLENLRRNVMGKGNGNDIIKELRELSKQTTIKKELNDGLDFIAKGIGRRWYRETYLKIGELRGKVKGL